MECEVNLKTAHVHITGAARQQGSRGADRGRFGGKKESLSICVDVHGQGIGAETRLQERPLSTVPTAASTPAGTFQSRSALAAAASQARCSGDTVSCETACSTVRQREARLSDPSKS